LNSDGIIKLYRFEMIPVHLENTQEVDAEKYYKVTVGSINAQGTGFVITIK
jgi:hypothetical protein